MSCTVVLGDREETTLLQSVQVREIVSKFPVTVDQYGAVNASNFMSLKSYNNCVANCFLRKSML